MPFLFVLISINVLSVSLVLVMCGKKENENGTGSATKNEKKPDQMPDSIKDNTTQINFTPQSSSFKRTDTYHAVAENFAFPASVKCKNHDDAWRILALYLDYIRAVNPVEFAKYKMLDSALAVLHDFSHLVRTAHVSNETIALSVVYFLIDFHKITPNIGTASDPWYKMLCRDATLDELERMRVLIEQDLMGGKSEEYSGNGTSAFELEAI